MGESGGGAILGNCHSETSEIVEPQQQLDSTSLAEDHPAMSGEADNTDGGIREISSVAPAVGAKFIIRENVYSSEGALGDNTNKNVTIGTVVPSQCELEELSTNVMARNGKNAANHPISYEITNNLEVKQEITGADPTPHEINEMHIPENSDEKEQNKEVSSDTVSHETDVNSSNDSYGENEQNEESIAETSASTSSSTSLPHEEGSTNTLEHMKWRVLLETPSGFAMFNVKEPLEVETAWMYFMDKYTARKVVSLIGFVKLDDKSVAWEEGGGCPRKELEHLIQQSLKDKRKLLVDTLLKDVVEAKFGMTCYDDDGVAGDLIWGLKNVLREFIPEERHNITKDYHFPLSKGWEDFLLKYSISVPANMRNSYLMSKIFLLRSLDLTLERIPKNLRKSFDRRVNGIGDHIKDDFMYVLVLARILVPNLTPNYNISKMFSSDLVLKIEEAKIFAYNYQEERLTLYDMQIILGALDHLGVVPGQIESVVTFIKLRLKELEQVAGSCDQEEKVAIGKVGGNEKRSIWLPIVGLLVLGGIVMQMVSFRGKK